MVNLTDHHTIVRRFGVQSSFRAFQLPGEIAMSPLTPVTAPPSTINITDCERDQCPAIQAVVIAAFRRIAADLSPSPQANLSVPIESFNPGGIPSVILMGKAPKTSSFNWVAIPAVGFELMRAQYGTADDHPIAVDENSSTVSVVNSGQTTVAGATLNADFIGSNFLANTSMRQFAVLVELEIPIDIYYLTFGVTGAASPVPETMRVEFTDTECRTIRLLCVQATRTRSVTNFGIPNVGNALTYQLPYNYGDVEQPGGSPIFLTISGYDSSNAQVAFDLPVRTWNIPYGGALTSALMAHKGVAAPGARGAFQVTPATFPIPNTQPTF